MAINQMQGCAGNTAKSLPRMAPHRCIPHCSACEIRSRAIRDSTLAGCACSGENAISGSFFVSPPTSRFFFFGNYPIGNSRVRLSWGRSQNNFGVGTPYDRLSWGRSQNNSGAGTPYCGQLHARCPQQAFFFAVFSDTGEEFNNEVGLSQGGSGSILSHLLPTMVVDSV